MYLLYVDSSGSPSDPKQRFFVLGGVAIFERQAHWISLELEKIAASIYPADPYAVELHGSPMLRGSGIWSPIAPAVRRQTILDALRVLADSKQSTAAFCIAVEKAAVSPEDPVEWAFEELCKRFDEFLKSTHINRVRGSNNSANMPSSNSQRGLMIFDQATKATSLQRLTSRFRTQGHSSDIIRNLVDVPMFVDSRATRLVQLADLVAYSTFRYVDRGDTELFNSFSHRIYSKGGVQHGLCVRRRTA